MLWSVKVANSIQEYGCDTFICRECDEKVPNTIGQHRANHSLVRCMSKVLEEKGDVLEARLGIVEKQLASFEEQLKKLTEQVHGVSGQMERLLQQQVSPVTELLS